VQNKIEIDLKDEMLPAFYAPKRRPTRFSQRRERWQGLVEHHYYRFAARHIVGFGITGALGPSEWLHRIVVRNAKLREHGDNVPFAPITVNRAKKNDLWDGAQDLTCGRYRDAAKDANTLIARD
jgi:hypothetical protein